MLTLFENKQGCGLFLFVVFLGLACCCLLFFFLLLFILLVFYCEVNNYWLLYFLFSIFILIDPSNAIE
jgi:hypothetical protein